MSDASHEAFIMLRSAAGLLGGILAFKAMRTVKAWLVQYRKEHLAKHMGGIDRGDAKELKCPFGFSSSIRTSIQEKKERVKILYEDYIHLANVREVWTSPITSNPRLEPVFAAAMHALEIGMLMIGTFVRDKRAYVMKRQRIDAIARCIEQQCILLSDLIDSSDEYEASLRHSNTSDTDYTPTSMSLSQTFPFPNCPPTVTADQGGGQQSACLNFLIAAVYDAFDGLGAADQIALRNVVRNISGSFDTAFSSWYVGVGIEDQLNTLRESVGLQPLFSLTIRNDGSYLDYKAMVKPERVLATYETETYRHSEDFFFRSIHLVTECWAFVALDCIHSAARLTSLGKMKEAAVRVQFSASIIEYMGTNIMALCYMNLRDYLKLKVEIEGTSGEGSSQVKELKPAARKLLDPLVAAARRDGLHDDDLAPVGEEDEEDTKVGELLLQVYMKPELYADIHAYAKALECLETAILSGFFYRHCSLAMNVIGSASRGTMQRSVSALRNAFETPLFPSLDHARTLLGQVTDRELQLNKGRIMTEIEKKRQTSVLTTSHPNPTEIKGEHNDECKKVVPEEPPWASSTAAVVSTGQVFENNCKDPDHRNPICGNAINSNETGCSGPVPTSPPYSPSAPPHFDDIISLAPCTKAAIEDSGPFRGEINIARVDSRLTILRLRQDLYKSECNAETAAAAQENPVVFMNHSFGQIPKSIHKQACAIQYDLFQNGDSVWKHFAESIVPSAQTHIRRLLHIAEPSSSNAKIFSDRPEERYGCHVEFGHNTFDLVSKLLSARLVTERCLRVLTTDSEFYSFNRQMKGLLDVAKVLNLEVQLQTVAVHPLKTFCERFAFEAVQSYRPNVIFVSQCVFKSQQTIIHNVAGWARHVNQLLPNCWVVVDGCHSFCSIDTDLSRAPSTLFYVSTFMKHAACGANAAFMLVPKKQQDKIRPLFTGWLADMSVLSPLSPGVCLEDMSPLGFQPGSSLAGGTPAFIPALIVFNLTQSYWYDSGIDVKLVHDYTMILHDRFYGAMSKEAFEVLFKTGVSTRCPAGGNDKSGSMRHRDAASLTLSLPTESASHAVALVQALEAVRIIADSRGEFVRFGLGLCHDVQDIDKLVDALEKIASRKFCERMV